MSGTIAAGADEGTQPTPRMEIVRGVADDDELAALAAVLPAAYLQETDLATVDEPAFDAWARARRLRRMPERGARWGRFTG